MLTTGDKSWTFALRLAQLPDEKKKKKKKKKLVIGGGWYMFWGELFGKLVYFFLFG
jgi:hypothetical protein